MLKTLLYHVFLCVAKFAPWKDSETSGRGTHSDVVQKALLILQLSLSHVLHVDMTDLALHLASKKRDNQAVRPV